MGREENIIKKLSPKLFVSNGAELELPNYSGVQKAALKTDSAITTITKQKYNGSDCTGSDGTTNRTLTATKTLITGNLVIVDRAVLIEDTDYTKSGAVITFLVEIFNDSKIHVIT